jgi:hypothetical protein
MRDADRPATDLHMQLERVEAASPAEAIDVVAAQLAAAVEAQAVRFLIADFSGRALVRIGPPAPGEPGARHQGDQQGQTLPLSGTVYEHVLRTQQIDMRCGRSISGYRPGAGCRSPSWRRRGNSRCCAGI